MLAMSQAIQDLPLASLIPVAMLIVVGVILWAAGRKVLRAGFGAAGLIVGAGLGWMILGNINLGIPPWIGAIVLGIGVACVAMLMYRMAVAGSLAIVFAIAAPMAVVTVAELQSIGDEDTPAAFAEQEGEDTLGSFFEDDEETDPLHDLARDHAASQLNLNPDTVRDLEEAARNRAQKIYDEALAWWESTPEQIRPHIVGAAVSGLLAGLLIGALAPSFSAVVVTAFGGSLLWLTSLRVVLVQIGGGVAEWLPKGAMILLILWFAVAGTGIGIQWVRRRKKSVSED